MTQARTTKRFFSRETCVSIHIGADRQRVWQLLIDGPNYTKWNSTVTSLEGMIEPGSTILLKSVLDQKRTFKLKIKTFKAPQEMSWGDAMGERIYKLSSNPNGGTDFSMSETIGGPIFPLFASKIPSFDASFDAFARDLKTVAERGQSS